MADDPTVKGVAGVMGMLDGVPGDRGHRSRWPWQLKVESATDEAVDAEVDAELRDEILKAGEAIPFRSRSSEAGAQRSPGVPAALPHPCG